MTAERLHNSRTSDEVIRSVVLALIVLPAALLRFALIDERPLHHDEAVNSFSFTSRGQQYSGFPYNPEKFHGPSLYYLTLPSMWLSRTSSYAQSTESTYRLVTAVLGIGLVVITISLGSGIGRGAATVAALLCTLSPAMVYYSRYYIHEMPLAFFTSLAILAGWRYLRAGRLRREAWGWAVLVGFSVGVMHATKETCVIAFAAALPGLLASASAAPSGAASIAETFRSPPVAGRHLLATLMTAVLVSLLFFSSFFTNMHGPLDSITAFSHYLTLGTVGQSPHHYPWDWYLRLLLYHRTCSGPPSGDAIIVALALIGTAAAVLRWGLESRHVPLARFFAGYTTAMVVIYSAIPYKTPWCVLSFLHGMTVLAGIGVVAALRSVRSMAGRLSTGALLLVALVQLVHQTWQSNFQHYTDGCNPYAYSQTLPDVRRLGSLVRRIAARQSGEKPVFTQVFSFLDNAAVCFYLRRVPNVFYTLADRIPEEVGAGMVLVRRERRAELEARLTDDYHVELFQIRPNVWSALFIRQDLWRAAAAPDGDRSGG